MILKENMIKKILLSFDVEEFNLPLEYGLQISKQEMYSLSKEGLINLTNLLKRYSIRATFFITANFAKRYKEVIKILSQNNEIACHGYDHADLSEGLSRIKSAKKEIEYLLGSKIVGFRSPRWKLNNPEELSKIGFKYDSSLHPIYLPGRYMNIHKKRKIHKMGSLIEVPMSTLPPNFSIFWLAFKNFPLLYSKIFTKLNFLTADYTMLLMHPWEFAGISKFKLPWYVNRIYGERLLKKLEDYLRWCKKRNYKFSTIENYLNDVNKVL